MYNRGLMDYIVYIYITVYTSDVHVIHVFILGPAKTFMYAIWSCIYIYIYIYIYHAYMSHILNIHK